MSGRCCVFGPSALRGLCCPDDTAPPTGPRTASAPAGISAPAATQQPHQSHQCSPRSSFEDGGEPSPLLGTTAPADCGRSPARPVNTRPDEPCGGPLRTVCDAQTQLVRLCNKRAPLLKESWLLVDAPLLSAAHAPPARLGSTPAGHQHSEVRHKTTTTKCEWNALPVRTQTAQAPARPPAT